MISFFAIASQDQSVNYLAQLFGSVGTVLVPSSGNTTFNIMSVIFKSLNTTALIIGAILVTHTTVMGLLKTATEGEFLGKQWSSLWVPFRMVIGIASLFPTAAGYSVLQIIMMWVILQGVGAADSLWTLVLGYVNAFGSPYSTVQLPTTVGVSQSISALFTDLVCEQSLRALNPETGQPYINRYTDEQGSHPYYYCGDQQHFNSTYCRSPTVGSAIAEAAGVVGAAGTNTGSQSVSAGALAGVANSHCFNNGNNSTICLFGPAVNPTTGACGSMVFGNTAGVCPGGTDIGSVLQCAGYQAQQIAVAWMVDVLYNVANDLVNLDNQYLQFTTAPLSPQAPEFISNYCQQNNIAPSACNGRSGSLPAASSSDNNSASDQLVQSILWPCYIESVVSGTGNPGGNCVRGNVSNVDFIGTNVTYYQNAINSGIATAMLAFLNNTQNLSSEWQTAQQTGWIMAGAYYYKIAAANGNNTKLSIPPFSVTPPANLAGSNTTNPAAFYRNNVGAAATLTSQIAQQSQAPGSATASISGFSQISGSMGGIAGDIWNDFSGMAGSSGQTTNPLAAMTGFGEQLINIAEEIFGATMGIMIPIIVAAGYGGDWMALGTGSTTNGLLEGLKFLFYGVWVIISAFMGWCFSFGGMIGIYTPLIPFIIFISGAIGWFIAVIEAMVASPFVALGILSPSGQHELLGKADAGLMILFATFLRPTLMVVGMMAAMILAPVAISLVNSGFKGVMLSINSSPGIYEIVIFITAYTSLVVATMNKVFALIHIVPDRALTWIGGHAGTAGQDSGEMTGAVKSATGAAGEAVGSGAKGLGDASGQAAASAATKGKQKGNNEAAQADKENTQANHDESMGRSRNASKSAKGPMDKLT